MVVALLLTVIADSIFYIISKRSIEKYIFGNLAVTVASRRAHIETYLEMLEFSIKEISKSVIEENFLKISGKESPGKKEAFEATLKKLRRTKKDNPEIAEFLLIDVTGKVAVSSDESSIGADKSADSIFLGALKETYIKDVYYSELKKMPLLAVSTPFLDNLTGELLGVLAARVSLDKLINIVSDKTGLGDTGEVYIINKYRYIITPSRFKEGAVLKQKVDAEKAGLSRYKGKERPENEKLMINGYPDYRGVQVVGMHQYIPQMHWVVLAEIDAKEAFQPLAKIKLLFLVILIITPLSAWLLGIFVGRLITSPLRSLKNGAQIIGSGNLDYKLGIGSKDEIGELTRAFDAMTNDLKKSMTSINDLNKEIIERNTVEKKIVAQSLELGAALKESKKSREVLLSLLEDNNKVRKNLQKNIDELKAAYTKLKEVQEQVVQSAKLASIGELAGVVAHEINNPLTGVINNVQLIKMEAEDVDSFKLEEFKELLNIVEESALRCKNITQSLLDFSHASKGESLPLSLNEIVEKVINFISRELTLQNILIQKDFQPDLPLILGDPQLLQQVFYNLISNAKWAIQKKSPIEVGTITIKTHYEEEKKEVCISFSDTGVGISKENLNKIFTSFFSTKELGEGTGLGLSLAQDIIHKHGGRIEIESQLGEGATFKISLPENCGSF